jgi:hypothetical protein
MPARRTGYVIGDVYIGDVYASGGCSSRPERRWDTEGTPQYQPEFRGRDKARPLSYDLAIWREKLQSRNAGSPDQAHPAEIPVVHEICWRVCDD